DFRQAFFLTLNYLIMKIRLLSSAFLSFFFIAAITSCSKEKIQPNASSAKVVNNNTSSERTINNSSNTTTSSSGQTGCTGGASGHATDPNTGG
ncbi:MAG: hypothetical protein ABUT20_36645, partial [Bacteroidota bacterium]